MKEIWKDIKEFDNYQVSNKGRVRSKTRVGTRSDGINFVRNGVLLRTRPNAVNGFIQVMLFQNSKPALKYVHRLVAGAFVENVNNLPCVTHIDGNRNHNNADNLQFTDYKQVRVNRSKNKSKSGN